MEAPNPPRSYSAVCIGVLLSFVVATACSVLNRQGPDVTCAQLDNGAQNACEEGIIATCTDGAVHYDVCDDEKACAASWQMEGAYRCSLGDLPFDPVTTPPGSTSSHGSSAPSSLPTSISPDPSSTASTGCDPSVEPCAVASSAGDAIEWFALDQDTIYFADCSTIWSLPKTGGFPTALSTAEARCPPGRDSMAQDASTLFFLRGMDLFSLAKTGGTLQQIPAATAMALASNSDHIYWMDLTDDAVKSVGKTGGVPQTISNGLTSFRRLSEHDGYLYWVNQEGLARISTAGPFPAAASTLPLDAYADDFFVAGSAIYFISSSEDLVGRIDLESGLATSLATAESGLVAITADENAVYWVSRSTRSEVRKVSVGGGVPMPVVSLRSGGGNSGIATDDTYVYWTQGSTLMRVVK